MFQRVAALGNLSATAREWGVPTSQVSRALTRMEKTCHARLVRRSTHGLTLTAEGDLFLAYCHRITQAVEELEGEFSSQTGDASGLVRVAASSVIAEHLLLRSLNELGVRHPRLRVALIVSDQKMDMARDGIDIAIRTVASLPETLVARKIGQLKRALYASASYAARAGLPEHPGDLVRHHTVTNSAATHLNRWAFKIDGVSARHVAEGHWQSNDTGMTTHMVLQGLGIGRLATVVAEPMVREGRLVPVLAHCLDEEPLPIYAVTSSTRQRLPKIKACIDFWSDQLAARQDTM